MLCSRIELTHPRHTVNTVVACILSTVSKVCSVHRLDELSVTTDSIPPGNLASTFPVGHGMQELTDTKTFKRKLKTFLFQQSYN